MNETTPSALRAFTLAARRLLFSEVEAQLEGVYGFLPDGTFQPAEKYPALADLPECRETRQRLETLIADEGQAGLKPKEARAKLVKEAAFTWLNRFVAFKMMEARGLVKQTVSKGPDSNAFKLWLTEPGNKSYYRDYEAGDLPQDAFGEGPRHRAYRRFLLSECGKLAEEIKVLFDPENLPSRLWPRPQAIKGFIRQLNAENLSEAWEPGNEEAIGWVYQGFNSEELERAFREVRLSSKKKFEAEDIPAVTQLFTHRWIVRYLVENTLGRLWVQMHPDTKLRERLAYLVPLEGEGQVAPLKPVREITLLDPACGTMHFGLVAFDLFVDMYLEELANAGREGWPLEASVDTEDDIPASVVANNLHGIDIDLRAVQLSALTLYLKAKTLNPRAKLTESRLACAGVHMLDGERLKIFIEDSGLQSPIYRRTLAALREKLQNSEQLGSLLRLEEEIRSVIEKEKDRYEREGRQLDMFGWSAEQFDTEAGRGEFWGVLEAQIGHALDAFARHQANSGHDQGLFVGEATKGLRFLEICGKRYDAVVTNPPYISARKMNPRLKGLVAGEYPSAKGDLYAAFTQRCMELTNETGRVGMLTMHSFMFISSYKDHRPKLAEQSQIETLAHAGPGLFDVGNPGTLQTAAYVLRREEATAVRENAVGTYFRLVKEPDAEAKREGFEQALARLTAGEDDPRVFRYRQRDFPAIPEAPWVYWITPQLRKLFQTLPKLGEVAPAIHGTATYKNFRFLRFWWEVGKQRIAFACSSWDDFVRSGKHHVPYMKVGRSGAGTAIRSMSCSCFRKGKP